MIYQINHASFNQFNNIRHNSFNYRDIHSHIPLKNVKITLYVPVVNTRGMILFRCYINKPIYF
jgi:hypothetical protein